jgi:hypothetical protein
MWTAFGVMLGLVADLALYNVPDQPHIQGLKWRLMLGSVRTKLELLWYTQTLFARRLTYVALWQAGLPAIVVMTQVYYCPESVSLASQWSALFANIVSPALKPRWLIEKGRYFQALKSLTRLRHSPLQAARDLFCSFR